MEPRIFFGLINIGYAVVTIAVCVPLIKRKIKMNRWYGVRIKKSFESDENWYELNAYGGKQLIVWSLPLIAVGVACFFIPFDNSNKDVLALALGTAPVLICLAIPIINIFRYARTMP